MGKGTDLKRRVVAAHAKDLETRLSDLLHLVSHAPKLSEPIEKDVAEALARVRNVIALLQAK